MLPLSSLLDVTMDLAQIVAGIFCLLLFLYGPFSIFRGLKRVRKAGDLSQGYLSRHVWPEAFPPFELMASAGGLTGALIAFGIIQPALAPPLLSAIAFAGFLIYGPVLIYLRIRAKERRIFRFNSTALSAMFLLAPFLVLITNPGYWFYGWTAVMGILASRSVEEFKPGESRERLTIYHLQSGEGRRFHSMRKADLRYLKMVDLMVEPDDDLSNLLACPVLEELSLYPAGEGLSEAHLALVGQLHSLKSLFIRNFGRRDNLGAIRNLAGLERLTMFLRAPSSPPFDPEGLGSLKGLQELELMWGWSGGDPNGPHALRSLDFLAQLTNLRSLRLSGVALPNPEEPIDLPGLKSIQLDYVWPGGLALWRSLPSLEEANLGISGSELESLDGISAAPRLRKLTVHGRNLDLRPLEGLSNLEELSLHGESLDLAPLQGVANQLRELRIDTGGTAPLSSLPSMAGLQRMEIFGYRNALASLEGIGSAGHLKALSLSGTSPELDLSPLFEALPDLEELTVGCRLTEVRGLGGLPNLRCLSLEGNDTAPTSLATLGSLPRLEEVDLTCFHSLDGLQSASGIRVLCWGLPSAGSPLDCAALAHLPNLQEITVVRNDYGAEGGRAAQEITQRIQQLCPKAKVELHG